MRTTESSSGPRLGSRLPKLSNPTMRSRVSLEPAAPAEVEVEVASEEAEEFRWRQREEEAEVRWRWP